MNTKKQQQKPATGLTFKRVYTKDTISPFDQFTYELRSSIIRNPSGEIVFEMNNVEVPAEWSQVATDILAQKYFRKAGVPIDQNKTGCETSVKQVVHRMVECWKYWGQNHHYFKTNHDAQVFYDELVYMLLAQVAAPNSPQWFNTGLYNSYGIKGDAQGHYYVDPVKGKLKQSSSAYEHPQPHACFILSVDDDLVNEGGIMDLIVREARIFKYGSGVGTNYSNIRGANEKLSGGGASSGLMSFLKIGDRAAGAIKSGGTTRRAAKMISLDLDHPEIEEFISWKMEEEKKVAALIAAGYSSDYEGEAYKTVSGQNANNSVRVPDSFFECLKEDKPWELTARTTGKTIKKIPAKRLWDAIAEAAWQCADPGVQFDTTINDWHTCPEGGRIKASNPCSEYMFLDNTACNLASLNLRKFYNEKKQEFNTDLFEHASRLWTVVLEISVLMAQFPSKEVAQLSYEYRTLGLGYANLGSILMVAGIPYDSDKARAIGASITSIMTATAYKTSAELASVLGPFSKYEENKANMIRVIKNHRFAAYNVPEAYESLHIKPQGIDALNCPDYLLKAACNAWDSAIMLGEKHGYRNAQVTAIAPTGTIGLLMDCDTTGVEPDFALVKFKKLSGGGYFKIVNQSVPLALKTLGYNTEEIKNIVDYAKGKASFKGAPFINADTLLEKGFSKTDLKKLEDTALAAFDIHFVFNEYTLGKECLERLGYNEDQIRNPSFNLLNALGFTEEQIKKANDYVCGTMTIEGAPLLKPEHLQVFDCANRCGTIGERFIHPHGHIKMMAAVQPFISGAISKTINLPNDATVNEIKDCYELSWSMGLKSNALYRDGSKLSQPLSSKTEKSDTNSEKNSESVKLEDLTPEQVLEAAKNILQLSTDTRFKKQLSNIIHKKRLPARRGGFTQKSKISGHTLFVRTGEYSDGTLGEIFIDMHKEGASFRSLLNCFAISVSIGLQYGVPLEEFVEKFTFTRFEPSGMVDHPNIKNATSVVDYLFRLLGFEYLNRLDLVQVKPTLIEKNEVQYPTNAEKKIMIKSLHPDLVAEQQNQQYLGNMMGDAPVCSSCGHITIRSGSCYKCLNCGTSLGCS